MTLLVNATNICLLYLMFTDTHRTRCFQMTMLSMLETTVGIQMTVRLVVHGATLPIRMCSGSTAMCHCVVRI